MNPRDRYGYAAWRADYRGRTETEWWQLSQKERDKWIARATHAIAEYDSALYEELGARQDDADERHRALEKQVKAVSEALDRLEREDLMDLHKRLGDKK